MCGDQYGLVTLLREVPKRLTGKYDGCIESRRGVYARKKLFSVSEIKPRFFDQTSRHRLGLHKCGTVSNKITCVIRKGFF